MTATRYPAGLSNGVFGSAQRRRILIVDDEDSIRRALARFLQSRGYEVDTAASGPDALNLIAPGRYAVMICDVRMPGMTGLELLPRARDIDPEVAIMMLTAVSDTPTAAESLGLGAMEYLMKPIELGELQLAIERVLHRRNVALEQRNVERIINDEVERRVTQLHNATHAYGLTHESLVRVVTQMEARDPWFMGMAKRVAGVAGDVARALQLQPEDTDRIMLAARLHDIGRVAVRESVLAKPAALSVEEFEHVKEHVNRGLAILEPAGLHQVVLDAVRDHHEHWDGSGYPAGKSAKSISLGGRILCAADAFVALTSPRPHRQGMTPRQASSIIAGLAGSILDPVITERLLRVVDARYHEA